MSAAHDSDAGRVRPTPGLPWPVLLSQRDALGACREVSTVFGYLAQAVHDTSSTHLGTSAFASGACVHSS